MNKKNYTFVLSPGQKKCRYNAGFYDPVSSMPKHEISVLNAMPELEAQVEINQFLMGNEGDRFWVWELTNNSTWPAFITIKKDGELVKMPVNE